MNREYESDQALAAEVAEHERRVILASPQASYNSVSGPLFQNLTYADTGEVFDIKAELRGKVTADVGSGCGALAKTAFLEEIETTIYSINPSLRIPMFKELYDLGFTKQILPAWYPGLPEQRYADAQDYHDAHQSTDFAHDLHFENNSFDFMVDANAVSKYMPQQSRVYGVSMREMLRVLRPGGKLLIIVDRGREQRRSSGKASAEEDRLRQLGVSYRLLHKPPTERKEYFAAVVTKPAS